MMTGVRYAMPTPISGPAPADTTHLRRVFGVGSLVFFGLAYLVPLTVFTTFGVATRITAGHLPMAYVVTSATMLFTALSYAVLVRHIPAAGSAFAFATRAFGTRFGFLTGWTLLLDYILLPAINYLIIGIYVNAQFPHIPVSATILAAIAVVTALNIVGVDVVRRISLILVLAQLAFAAVFLTAVFTGDAVTPTLAPFYSDGMTWGGIFAGAAILCLSFLGFDAVSTLAEEAKDPSRTVPRAILMTTFAGGAIFVLLSYASALVLPDWQNIQVHDSAGLEVMEPLGKTISALFLSTYLAGSLASAIAAQASVSRILYAMGRDGVLPRGWFGRLNARFRTPAFATLTVAAASLITLAITLDTLASLISFGALFAFSVVNLAVPRIFLADRANRAPRGLLLYGLCPLIGFALTAWLWSSLSALALMVGLSWLALGAGYSLLRGNRPTVLAEA